MRLLLALFAACLLVAPLAAQRAPYPEGTTEIAFGTDPLQRLDFTPAAVRRAPLFIFIHGGGWSFGDKRMAGHMAAHFHGLGYAFASLDYRLVPNANPQQQAEDVAAAIAELVRNAERLGIDPGRIILGGHSAGAHLAALVGTDPRYLAAHRLPISILKGIVLLDGAGYDVPTQMQRAGPFLRRMYSRAFGEDAAFQASVSPTLQAAAPNAGRFLIFHITSRPDDSGAQSQALAAALRRAGTPAEVIAVDNTHAEIFRGFGQPGHVATARTDAFAREVFGRR
ncbi:alpha/beta hydrolase [Allosphingosinicella sp.]|uniref:alpha/beta hydrolase n=1 Tax=Allosphingosinicella sp. TaxID=2823234 RepID=UPI0037842CE6